MSKHHPQYFRNNNDIHSIENILIDASSLWKLDAQQNLLVLEDDDQYITTKLDFSKFTETN